ncbi:MAG: formyltransferase [Candidatus Puniceispirillum sp.]|nr:formyltransferase [Candidatus Pelagibacter sp.]MBA4283011.1 formyltransferase [Candidatus Puniceispirillum sp.]
MKCMVFAYSQLGHDCLKFMIEKTNHEVCLVITHEDNPEEEIWFDSVEKLATTYNIPVYKPSSLKEEAVQKQILQFRPDALFSFYYRMMIPASIFEYPTLGAYNMHGSLLPKYRGRCPVNWAILNGEKETGVTLHEMVTKADQGDILGQKKVSISCDATAGEVTDKLIFLAVELLKEQIDLISEQKIIKTPQNHSHATYYGGRKPEDGQINWSWSPQKIADLIRALQPFPQYPPAYGFINGEKVFFRKSVELTSLSQNSPLKGRDEHGMYHIVKCGSKMDHFIKLYIQD